MSFCNRFLRAFRATTILVVTSVGTGACTAGSTSSSSPSDTGSSAGRVVLGFAQFPDIAVPAGAKMNIERSLVLGARDNWIGRLSMNTGQRPSTAYGFFLREMPKFRWQEITTVRSETSVLTYRRDERIATIQITEKTLGGSRVDVTVSPRGRPPVPSPLMPAEPAGGVTITPR